MLHSRLSFSRSFTAAVLSTAAGAFAQIPISGNLPAALSAGVYHASGSLTVPLGATTTLNPGVIIKLTGGSEVTVHGTLLANGTAANPVIFTDIQDDSAGGDTNGNGPSVGNPTAWRGIVFSATSSASVLTYADVRYGGAGFVPNLHLNSANPTFVDCVSRDCYTHGMLLAGDSFPTLTRCSFVRNGGVAVEGVSIKALAGFANNTASGNTQGNYARVTTGAVDANLTVGPAAMISGAIVLDTTITVDANRTWTLQGGTVVKFRGPHEIAVNGTLNVQGASGSPVVFTDLRDDSAGGDTNGNGPSAGNATAWRGIVFNPTAGGSVLTHADVRYGGAGFVSNIVLNGASPTFVDCVVRDCYTHGMQLNGSSFPTVTRCAFTNNGGFAVENVALDALAGFQDNTASGNVQGSYARILGGLVTGNLVLGPRAMIGGALVADTTIQIPVGSSLRLLAGTVVKFRGPHEVTVDGSLFTDGTPGNPVVFTDLRDDSAGGDTNGNGPSAGNATAWRGIVFNPTSGGSVLTRADVRYGGASFVPNLALNSANPTFVGCVSRNCYTHGMELNANSHPTVTNCSFRDNGNLAVSGVPITAVPGFTNNSASGNGVGNYLNVTVGSVPGYLKIGPQSILEGALVLSTSLVVSALGHLVVEQGVNFKCNGAHEVIVDGAIELRGTGYEPIVFTEIRDDSVAGDTNNNGPSVGSWTGWRGVTINASPAPARLENVVIRYTGASFVPALTVGRDNTVLRSVRADAAFTAGFVLDAAMAHPTNLVAYGCGGNGIHLVRGAFDLLHATAVGNAQGIRKEVGFGGRVLNSISYGNSGQNFANFGAGTEVAFCNGGFAGVRGNRNVDPLFVNQAGGDLHLGLGSPCLGAADLMAALATVKDFDENSRLLDHDLSGFPNPDMGAFERPAWDMAVAGVARPGQTLTFTISGPPGQSFLGLGLLDGVSPFVPWGMLLAGANPGTSVALLYPIPLPVGFAMPLPLSPSPNLIGATAGIQTLTLAASNPNLGNFTRLYRVLIRP